MNLTIKLRLIPIPLRNGQRFFMRMSIYHKKLLVRLLRRNQISLIKDMRQSSWFQNWKRLKMIWKTKRKPSRMQWLTSESRWILFNPPIWFSLVRRISWEDSSYFWMKFLWCNHLPPNILNCNDFSILTDMIF